MGIASMAFALTFTLVAAIMVNLSGAEEPAPTVAAVEPQAAETPVQVDELEVGETPEPDTGPRKEPRQQPREKPHKEPRTAKTPIQKNAPEIVEKVEAIEQPAPTPPEKPPAKPREDSSATPQVDPPARPQENPPEQPASRPQEEHEERLPIATENLPPPSQEEVAAASRPRHYPWQEGAVFTLTIAALEIYNAPVLNSTSPEALSSGVVHIPETPMPWDGGQHKNVYLAGHRVGLPGTNSRVLFYHLDTLTVGDSIVLEDRQSNAYRYRVSEIFVVEPDAGWVLDPIRNRDMVTLQTCTYPTFENRLIVRADRI